MSRHDEPAVDLPGLSRPLLGDHRGALHRGSPDRGTDGAWATTGEAMGRRGERSMVPPAEPRSYYGRPVVKASPWGPDIPAYFFFGGLAAGSSLLAAGADLTGRAALRRRARLTAVGALGASVGTLVHDLGRPSRFHHMLRVAKPTSPMSVGTWLLAGYGPLAGLAAASELLAPPRGPAPAGRVPWAAGVVGTGAEPAAGGPAGLATRAAGPVGRGAGLAAAALAPAIATYTGVLVADTATPTWHEGGADLPRLFAASAASAAGGIALALAPLAETGPAWTAAAAGAAAELVIDRRMSQRLGALAEPMDQGRAGRYHRVARACAVAGLAVGALGGRRHRAGAVAAGSLLAAGSWCERFAVFHAGQQSADDPRYTVQPQRDRLDRSG